MKIRELLLSKEISEQELETCFELEKEKSLNQNDSLEECWNCGAAKYFVYRVSPFSVERWQYIQYCINCKRINLRYKCEPMGGNQDEPVKVFKEK